MIKIVAAGAAVAVLAFGATAVAKHGSSTPSGGQFTQPATGAPQAGPAGMFSPVTGTTLAKLKAVATAKYPGTVEHAMQLPDGSYEVHVIQSGGQEVHVHVSKAFKVTGTEQGGPPAGGFAPGGRSAPGAGAAPNGQAAPDTGSATQS